MKTILNPKHLASILVLGAAMTLMTIVPSSAEPTNLLTNGSFEDPICPIDKIGFWTTHYLGDSIMTGWAIGLGGIDHMCTFWQATDGERSVDLSGDAAGSISQIIPTVTGKTYDVSFDMTGNYFCGSSTKLMTVNAPGYSQQFDYEIPVGISQTDMKYEEKTFSFVAVSSTSQIEFVSNDLNPCGPVLDNVVVVENIPPVTTVDIDVKPGSDVNPVNTKSKGVIPVAVLSTIDFDATSIDPDTVVFGPNDATESHGKAHIEDVNGDGLDDVVLHFKTQDSGIVKGDTEVSLTGATFDGTAIEGSDNIKTK